MAKATRVRIQVISPLGNLYYQSVFEVTAKVEKKRAQWIELNVSAVDVVAPNLVDYSRKMGPHYNWKARDSGCATVMQLI